MQQTVSGLLKVLESSAYRRMSLVSVPTLEMDRRNISAVSPRFNLK